MLENGFDGNLKLPIQDYDKDGHPKGDCRVVSLKEWFDEYDALSIEEKKKPKYRILQTENIFVDAIPHKICVRVRTHLQKVILRFVHDDVFANTVPIYCGKDVKFPCLGGGITRVEHYGNFRNVRVPVNTWWLYKNMMAYKKDAVNLSVFSNLEDVHIDRNLCVEPPEGMYTVRFKKKDYVSFTLDNSLIMLGTY